MKKMVLYVIVLTAAVVAEHYKDTVIITDDSLQPGESYVWDSHGDSIVYGLVRHVFLEEGASLEIKQGTVIKALGYNPKADKDYPSASLIICRGATLRAEGTPENPIVFTSVWDDLDSSGTEDDIGSVERGLWGGVILLGAAPSVLPGKDSLTLLDTDDERLRYGGTAYNDSSGVLQHVGIAYADHRDSVFHPASGLKLVCTGNRTVVKNVTLFNPEGKDLRLWSGSIPDGDALTLSPQSDHEICLVGNIFVQPGGNLAVEAGTVVKAYGLMPQVKTAKARCQTSFTPAHITVCRGAFLHVDGTREKPVLFTSVWDDITDSSDIHQKNRGLWGGIAVCGKAIINDEDGEDSLTTVHADSPLLFYGGENDDDSSGVLRYMSVRYAGCPLVGLRNPASAVLFAGTGSRTVVEHVDVYNSYGPCFTWRGGSVNCRYLVSAFSAANAGVFDMGYQGRIQYMVAVLRNEITDNNIFVVESVEPTEIFKHANSEASLRMTRPVVANATLLQAGYGGQGTGFQDNALLSMGSNGGIYMTSIFAAAGDGIESFDTLVLEDGDQAFYTNVFWNICQATKECGWYQNFFMPTDSTCTIEKRGDCTLSEYSLLGKEAPAWYLGYHLEENGNSFSYPEFAVPYSPDDGAIPDGIRNEQSEFFSFPFDLRPMALSSHDSCVCSGFVSCIDTTCFLEAEQFKGAFSPYSTTVWIDGWTTFADYGFLSSDSSGVPVADSIPDNAYHWYCPETCAEYCDPVRNAHHFTGPSPSRNTTIRMSVQGKHGILSYSHEHAGPVDIRLFDMTGRVRVHIAQTHDHAGRHTLSFDRDRLGKGCFIVSVKTRRGETVIPLSLVR